MKAYLETTFKKGFLLTEENLIKLDDIIRRRIFPGDSSRTLKYKVFRVDGMLLEFDAPAEVVAEENSSRNAISKLEILSSDAHNVHLVFDPKNPVSLEIESDDRDVAYLLFSDVKEYLNSEVLKFRSASFESLLSSGLLFPIVMMIALGMLTYSASTTVSDAEVTKVLASSDVNQKLDFLIHSRPDANMARIKYYLLGMFVFVISFFFFLPVLDRVFPRNLFCWGKAASSHVRLVRIREKWIWGVAIAFIVGILSTVAVDQFKK